MAAQRRPTNWRDAAWEGKHAEQETTRTRMILYLGSSRSPKLWSSGGETWLQGWSSSSSSSQLCGCNFPFSTVTRTPRARMKTLYPWAWNALWRQEDSPRRTWRHVSTPPAHVNRAERAKSLSSSWYTTVMHRKTHSGCPCMCDDFMSRHEFTDVCLPKSNFVVARSAAFCFTLTQHKVIILLSHGSLPLNLLRPSRNRCIYLLRTEHRWKPLWCCNEHVKGYLLFSVCSLHKPHLLRGCRTSQYQADTSRFCDITSLHARLPHFLKQHLS